MHAVTGERLRTGVRICLLPAGGQRQPSLLRWLETPAQVWGSSSGGTLHLCALLHSNILHCQGAARAQFLTATFGNPPVSADSTWRGLECPEGFVRAAQTLLSGVHPP